MSSELQMAAQKGTAGFTEDLKRAAQRALDLAPVHCSDCSSYHMIRPLKRYFGKTGGLADREILVGRIGTFLATTAKHRPGPIRILLAGAADSGLLAVCVRAGIEALGSQSERVRFHVLDRCRTPLILCEDFARDNGLEIETSVADLLTSDVRFSADLIVLHSLFSFIQPDVHVDILGKLSNWLEPDGRIVFSTDVRPPQEEKSYSSKRASRTGQIKEGVTSGLFRPAEPLDSFLSRLDRSDGGSAQHKFDFVSGEQVMDLFAASGLVAETTDDYRPSSTDGKIVQDRLVAVLKPGPPK